MTSRATTSSIAKSPEEAIFTLYAVTAEGISREGTRVPIAVFSAKATKSCHRLLYHLATNNRRESCSCGRRNHLLNCQIRPNYQIQSRLAEPAHRPVPFGNLAKFRN